MKIIITLNEYPEYVPLVAKWAFEAWGGYNPSASLEKAQQKFNQHLNKNALPLTLLALDNNIPIGMCSLRESDGILPELSPWLGSLYVEPAYRGKGVGKQLIEAIIKKSQEMNYAQLYLLTFEATLPYWYEKLGWQNIGADELNGYPITVMKYE